MQGSGQLQLAHARGGRLHLSAFDPACKRPPSPPVRILDGVVPPSLDKIFEVIFQTHHFGVTSVKFCCKPQMEYIYLATREGGSQTPCYLDQMPQHGLQTGISGGMLLIPRAMALGFLTSYNIYLRGHYIDCQNCCADARKHHSNSYRKHQVLIHFLHA